ncbi:MAG: DNA polymerase III subunit gamma/tau [Candidatus Humimicrobiaceae bacterium]
MGYISFYRKWRPQSLDDVIGQKYNIQTLKNVLAGNRLSHSYMFCGPRGTGKTSTARIFAKAINCVDGITSSPCNKCKNCLSISNGSNVDVIEIDAASNRGINEIRELREKVKYLPNNLRKKVYIIDEVHMLTTEAFNALLKVLEEPPEHVIFIMATTEPNKVLPTIMSRCQRFDFNPISLDLIGERLKKIAKSEKLSISDQALGLIARYADGSLRDADGILEQLAAYSEGKIEAKDVVALLGIVDLEILFQFVDILAERNISKSLETTKSIIKSNQNLKVFVSELLDHLYNIYIVKNYDKPDEVTDISKEYLDKYSKQAENLNNEEIEFYLDHFTELLKQIKWGESSKTFFRTAVVQAVNFIVLDDKQINKKIKAWEAKIHSLEREVKSGATGRPFEQESASVGEPGGEPQDLYFLNDTDEAQLKPKNGSGIENKTVIDPEPESQVQKPAKTGVKKGNTKSVGLKSITENLDRILELLKRKKISVHAMFVEAEPDRIEGNTIFFCLEENKKWHKDHLNKAANSDIISGVIGEVIGEKYQVEFETGSINTKNQMKNYSSQKGPNGDDEKINRSPGIDKNEKTKNEDRGAAGDKKSPKESSANVKPLEKKDESQTVKDDKDGTIQKDKDDVPAKDENEDMLKYFEKKFEIKE